MGLSDAPTLRCEHLRKAFGGVLALDEVSLEFAAPGITALVGPNGAGKTTLFNILSGFARADRGRSFYGAQEISLLPPAKMVRLGIARTFQENRVLRSVSVLDHVLMARQRQRGENPVRALLGWGYGAQERANRRGALSLLERVGLGNCVGDSAAALSYGQQKMLAIACCIATGSRTMLVDEPVAGLHPGSQQPILRLLSGLRDEGCCVVFIEHNMGVVAELAERVVVMSAGKVMASGPPREVLQRRDVFEAYLG